MPAEQSTPEALLMTITNAMPERVDPRCKHFGTCGGCQLQDLQYTQQVSAKAAMLQEILQRAGVDSLPPIQTHTAHPWEYRNRARFRVEDGAVGYSRRASNDFLAIEECPIVSPLIWHTVEHLRLSVRNGKAMWPYGTDAVEVFTNGDDSAVQLSFHLNATVSSVDRAAPRASRALCDTLRTELPQLAGAGMSVATEGGPALRRRLQESQRAEIARWGEPALTYTVDRSSYRITRNAFFQVNRFLTASMVEVVLADYRGAVAYDLFAGAGLFSVPLTERFDQVFAVEIAEPAAGDLAAHLQVAGPQHRAVRSTVLNFLTKQSTARAPSPDLIVLDPPRAGLNIAATDALVRTGGKTLVYVSCNAATFARDARPLVHSGYILDSLHLFDLFPQTFHTETIAVFRR